MRWVQANGWRPVEPVELDAACRFYVELGNRMGLNNIPRTYTDAEAFYSSYETKNVRPSPEGHALMDATMHVLADRLPAFLRPFIRPGLAALIANPRMTDAIGLPTPRPFLSWGIRNIMRLRNIKTRHSRPQEKPSFIPGKSASAAYPNGYDITDIGPRVHSVDR
jgi:hypothetical protein